MLELRSPLVIGPRLLPALQVGDSWVYVTPEAPDLSGDLHRTIFRVIIDTPDGEIYNDADLNVVTQTNPSDTVREAMRSAVSFLCYEGDHYPHSPEEDSWLFNAAVAEWAYQNEGGLSVFSDDNDDDFDFPKEDA